MTKHNMWNLYLSDITYSEGYSILGLNITVIACVVTGILVILTKNPIVSILFLIGLFLNISGNLAFLGVNFIALSYLLVYVGAVSILFLFILMLINIRISEIVSSTRNSMVLAIALGLLFFSTVYDSLPIASDYAPVNYTRNYDIKHGIILDHKPVNYSEMLWDFNIKATRLNLIGYERTNEDKQNKINFMNQSYNDIQLENPFIVNSNFWDSSISHTSHIVSLGNILYTSYPILIILTGLILLLSMVGSIVITVKTRS